MCKLKKPTGGPSSFFITMSGPLFKEIERGCSQGTVGGPGIFSMYTDDLKPQSSMSRIFKYSDDTNCLNPCVKNPSNRDKERFSKEIQTIVNWAAENGLSLNTEKSKHIRFCLNRTPYCECERIGEHFASVNQVKILGITFQRDCSFRHHCRRLLSELRSSMYLFKDLKSNGIRCTTCTSLSSSLECDTVFRFTDQTLFRYKP